MLIGKPKILGQIRNENARKAEVEAEFAGNRYEENAPN